MKTTNNKSTNPTDNHAALSRKTGQIKSNYISVLITAKVNKWKKQKARTALFTSLGFCLSLLLMIVVFNTNFSNAVSTVSLAPANDTFNEMVDIPVTEQPPPPPPQVAPPKIVEVPNDEEVKNDIKVNLDVEMNQETKIPDVVASSPMPEEKADEVFTIVEDQPSPVGGMTAFYQYVQKKLKYPAQARRMGIEGKVFVQFIVDKDGSITDVKAVKGIGAGCDEEAVRVLQDSPKWNPGKQRGRPVKVRMILPITFRLG